MEGYQVATLLDKPGEIMDNIRIAKPDILLLDVYLGDRNGIGDCQEYPPGPQS